MKSPFRYFNSSPEVIRLVVMMYVKYPLSALSEQLARCQPAAIGCLDEEPVSLFQQFAGGNPAGRDDVRQIPALSDECGTACSAMVANAGEPQFQSCAAEPVPRFQLVAGGNPVSS